MNEKELVKNLAALGRFSPDREWVTRNREILSYQIHNGKDQAVVTLGFFSRVGLVVHRLAQPTPIAALIALFFVISGAFGFRSYSTAKPGETLYMVREIGEKAQLAMTFNEKDRVALNLEFAQTRAAELDKLAAENGSADTSGNPTAQNLSDNFKKEIAAARERLSKLDQSQARQAAIDAQAQSQAKLNVKAPKAKKEEAKEGESAEEPKADDANAVFSADSGKESQGIDISLPGATQKVLDDAEQLFNQKKYKEAADKLEGIKLK